MNTQHMPGFTADASIYKTSENYQVTGDITAQTENTGVFPQLQKFSAWGSFVDDLINYCNNVGGGLSSNPDGSITCTIYDRRRVRSPVLIGPFSSV